MFSDKLFDHKYDIDELIEAFCSGHISSVWVLNTRNAEITPLPSNDDVEDGGDNNHIHIIESLPPSFMDELTQNYKFSKLGEETQKEVVSIINNCTNVHDLLKHAYDNDAGSYIIKTLKAACLDWLDMRNLIPPSMRHTSDMSMFDSLSGTDGQKHKIKISIK